MSASTDFDRELISHCLSHHVIPLMMDETSLNVAAEENCDVTHIINALRFICNRQINVTFWSQAQLAQARKTLLKSTRPKDASHTESSDEASSVNFINQTLEFALQHRASDVHFEPNAHSYRVRLRIDGVLQNSPIPMLENTQQIATRLKIMASLDIAERRLPQDGQITFSCNRQTYSLRISTLPLLHGEKIVLRILASHQPHHDLTRSGMTSDEQTLLRKMLNKPQGLILVTGPTGSGKTATLYNSLHVINDGRRNICSIEDPVELPLPGINQCQVNVKAKFTFATALRAFLRQDPDVIMVGEIRDKETADIAIEAAQTGHLVLSTLHTNSTTETLIRLKQMGIPTYLLASSLKLVIAQRLFRQLCSHCRLPHPEPFFSELAPNLPIQTWQAKGCPHCFSGYYQRSGLFEILVVTPAVQHAILHDFPADKLQKIACEQGMKTLYQQGLTFVEQGITSLAEFYRVLDHA